jgi:acetyl esterase
MALDPQAQALLDQMQEAGAPPFEQMTVGEARQAAYAFIDLQGAPEDVASVGHRFVPGPVCDLPVRIYTPEGEGPFPALVYFHGSGWVILNIEVADIAARALTNRTGCVVVAVNYQKAPEHKFPVPFDDAYAATTWVAEHASELGIDPGRIGVAGDSAGGNLAAAVCLKARDEHGPSLAYQLLIYPVTDYGWDKPSYLENAEGYLLQRETMRWFWGHYLASEAEGDNPLVSPLRPGSLRSAARVDRDRGVRSAAGRRGAVRPAAPGGRGARQDKPVRRDDPWVLLHGRCARPDQEPLRRDRHGGARRAGCIARVSFGTAPPLARHTTAGGGSARAGSGAGCSWERSRDIRQPAVREVRRQTRGR